MSYFIDDDGFVRREDGSYVFDRYGQPINTNSLSGGPRIQRMHSRTEKSNLNWLILLVPLLLVLLFWGDIKASFTQPDTIQTVPAVAPAPPTPQMSVPAYTNPQPTHPAPTPNPLPTLQQRVEDLETELFNAGVGNESSFSDWINRQTDPARAAGLSTPECAPPLVCD